MKDHPNPHPNPHPDAHPNDDDKRRVMSWSRCYNFMRSEETSIIVIIEKARTTSEREGDRTAREIERARADDKREQRERE